MASSRGGASGKKAPPQEPNFFDLLFGMCSVEHGDNERAVHPSAGKEAMSGVSSIANPPSPTKVPPERGSTARDNGQQGQGGTVTRTCVSWPHPAPPRGGAREAGRRWHISWHAAVSDAAHTAVP